MAKIKNWSRDTSKERLVDSSRKKGDLAVDSGFVGFWSHDKSEHNLAVRKIDQKNGPTRYRVELMRGEGFQREIAGPITYQEKARNIAVNWMRKNPTEKQIYNR